MSGGGCVQPRLRPTCTRPGGAACEGGAGDSRPPLFSREAGPERGRGAGAPPWPRQPRGGSERGPRAFGKLVVVSRRQTEFSERKSFHANLISCFDELYQCSRLGECPRKCGLLSVEPPVSCLWGCARWPGDGVARRGPTGRTAIPRGQLVASGQSCPPCSMALAARPPGGLRWAD